MAPGSVVVDLAAERGGNVEATKPGETIRVHGVTVMGPLNLASSIPYHASQMYARNVAVFIQNFVKDGVVNLSMDDEIIRDTTVARDGNVTGARVRELLGMAAPATV
jgi:NAD(P) transhydrogenase subunit alpha